MVGQRECSWGNAFSHIDHGELTIMNRVPLKHHLRHLVATVAVALTLAGLLAPAASAT
jgi:hypothetical protein